EGVMLRAALPAPLAPSTYTVQWKAVTGDGHSVEGSYQFGVSESARAQSAWRIVGGVVAVLAALVVLGLSGVYFARRRAGRML
ncbi:MAG: copper resistance protein CopC, partial [Anaerolineales bacterium]